CGALSCDILTYGGALRSLRVPDRSGSIVDVILGFDTLEDYRRQDKYIGALIGRFANRIGGAAFELDGTNYPLFANDGENHLHGGMTGFDKQVWTVEKASSDTLVLSLISPDGQENYPGNLSVQVTYRLEHSGLTIEYRAECDRDTLCNLTNHAYFNLNGHDSGPVLSQEIQISASRYTPTDPHSIPTGELASVEHTPMDLRSPMPIGTLVDDSFAQLAFAKGYDHNWAVDGEPGSLRPAATAYGPGTGIVLEVLTTQPGIQFYSGNYLDGCPAGKGGASYAKRWAFCLETQGYPDAPHHPGFPSAVLHKGKRYHQTTQYRFSVR
ncbi:aldose epimerase family protein, partial [Oscillibacter sp.]|uniref:aldose epimerase family protein n=1 Tax=Oscillibacter sp. TaxID=1945593 RepID=UPI0028A866A3